MITDPGSAGFKAHFRQRLLTELEQLREASEQTERDRKPVELDQQSVGRLSRMDAMQGQAMASASEARRRQRIVMIEQALQRLEDDDYGYCADCGEPIAPGRLEVDPAVPRCVACA